MAPGISFQSILEMDWIIKKPTIIRAGAVAKPGIARKTGAQISYIRNSIAAVYPASPVLAPALIPTADSAKVVVVLVPRMAPKKVAAESASRILLRRGISPFSFISGVLATAPLVDPMVSKKSVNKKAKQTIIKSTENKSFQPEFPEVLCCH